MKIETFVTGSFQENAYLVADERAGAAALVDPGADARVLLDAIDEAGVALRAIWLTHAHLDHIGAIAELKRAREVPVLIHPADLPLYRAAPVQAQYYGLAMDAPPEPDGELAEGMTLSVGDLEFHVMHTPGHSPGHVVIHGHGVAFVGDCLFAGSIGRTDLPLSNGAELGRSLQRITALPASTRVFPGHGPATTILDELQSNPFLGSSSILGVVRP